MMIRSSNSPCLAQIKGEASFESMCNRQESMLTVMVKVSFLTDKKIKNCMFKIVNIITGAPEE